MNQLITVSESPQLFCHNLKALYHVDVVSNYSYEHQLLYDYLASRDTEIKQK